MGACQRLLPLATVGDGNCLLHAASLGMWGYHDRLLTLRKALYRTLTSHLAKGSIKRRWRFQQWQKNMDESGLVYSEQEWEKEWLEVLRIASTQRRLDKQKVMENSNLSQTVSSLPIIVEKDTEISTVFQSEEDVTSRATCTEKERGELTDNAPVKDAAKVTRETMDLEQGAFESLEDIHVFVLAHVLRRPMIIIADKFLYDFSGEPIAPIPFGGVYLPLECEPGVCFKNPLVLAFDAGHFSPLVLCDETRETKSGLSAAVPLVGPNCDLLPVQFSIDPGEEFVWSNLDSDSSIANKLALNMDRKLELLKKYLNVELLKIPSTDKKDAKDESKVVSPIDRSWESSSVNGNGNKYEKKSGPLATEKKEKLWIASHLMKAGNIAGFIGNTVHNTSFVAKLQTDKRPDYYDKMIQNYIQSAKERFEEEKKSVAAVRESFTSTSERPQQCFNPGCQLYGTSLTNYLCSGCFKAQKSLSEKVCHQQTVISSSKTSSSGKGPTMGYDNTTALSYFPHTAYSAHVPFSYFGDHSRMQSCNPCATQPQKVSTSPLPTHVELNSSKMPLEGLPSYGEVMEGRYVGTRYIGTSSVPTNHTVTSDSVNTQKVYTGTWDVTTCITDECKFFGSPQNEGYCSACYKKYQKTLKYKAMPKQANS